MRFQQGVDDRPTRLPISATESDASSCRTVKILRSMASIEIFFQLTGSSMLYIEKYRNTRVHRRAREAIRDVMKMLKGLSKEQHAELRDVIEAVRKAGYAEGYAAAKMEAALAAAESVDSPEAPAAPPPNPKAIQPIMEVGEYISR